MAISDILNSAHNEKIETKIIANSAEPTELYEIVDKLKTLIKRTQYEEFAKMSNYDLFNLYFCFNNDTISMIETGQSPYFANAITYEELYSIVEESKDIINSWTFNNQNDLLNKAIHPKSQSDYINACQLLGLSPYVVNYDMNQVFIAISNLLYFKTQCNIIQFSGKHNNIKKKEIKELFNKVLSQTISILIERSDSTKKFYKTRKENCQIKLECLEELINASDEGKLENMDLIEGKWHQYLDPTTLNPLYDLLLENQYKRNQSLNKLNKELKDKINETPFINYLYMNGINPKSIKEDKLQNLNEIDFEELITKINFFKKIGFTLEEILLSSLLDTSIEAINKLSNWIDRSIIKKETIKNDITILDKILTIDTNYSILKPIIEINSIYYNDKILLLDTIEIKRRISILAEYQLTKNNYMFLLCNFKYLKLYDLFIEHDLPLYIFIPVCKTYNPLLTLKKIILCKELDIPYEVNGILTKEINKPNSFMCSDEQIDEFIINTVPDYILDSIKGSTIVDIKDLEVVKSLDAKYRVGDIYRFGHTNISRPKVLRNLQTIKNNNKDTNKYLFFTLISDSILNDSNIQEIKNNIQKKTIS